MNPSTLKITPREKVKFKFSSKMAKLLGRQSVSNDIVAIFELVKNAYDADSPKVIISFQNIEQNDALITISDYGDGMTKDDILHRWMVIGTNYKEKARVTYRGRRMIGEKGLGRFATERLAQKMTLISYPKNSNEVLELRVDWDKYENEQRTFEEIEHDLFIRPPRVEDRQGVQIILENLRDLWDEEKITQLKNELSSLVLPADLETNHPFTIEVIDSKSEGPGNNIQSSLLSKAPYKLKAILDEGKIILWASIKNKEVFGKKLRNDIVPNVSMKCGPAVFYYYGFARDPTGSSLWRKYYGPVTMQRIDDMLKIHSGIRIYRDGFRIKPYGDPYNDWTHREDKARGRAGALPNDRTIGWVEIHGEKNPQIIDTTTREKLIENDAFLDLVNFVDICLQKLNTEIYKRRTKVFGRSDEVEDRLLKLEKTLEEEKNIPLERKQAYTKSLDKTRHIVKEREQVLMTKIEAYRNLATLGITTGVVSHEVGGDLAQMINVTDYLNDLQNLNPDIASNISDLSDRVSNIQSYMQMLRGYTSTLKSNSSNFRKKEQINCYKLVDKTLLGLMGICQKNNIICENNVDKELCPISMFRTDFQSILINFLSNSIKSLKAKMISHAGQNFHSSEGGYNRIKVTCNLSGDNFVLTVSDNGLGIDKRIKDTIFDIFTSYSMCREVEQDGSGLGLSIVKDIVEEYHGQVYVDNPEFGDGATLTVKIPIESLGSA